MALQDTDPTVANAGIAPQSPADIVGTYRAPDTNGALQLAGALQETSPKVDDFLTQFGMQQRTKDQAAAHQAAMKSSAAGFSDAVRSGELPGAKSPWFVQQFNQDRAQIASQEAAQKVVADSQTWQERGYQDGGVAYEQRLQQAMGDISQQVSQVPGMHPIDAQEGFTKGAEPVVNQAILQNRAYQVQSIQTQKVQDTTTLLEKSLGSYLTANPNAKPTDALAAMQPTLDSASKIGFQESDLKEMAFNAIIGAAFNTKDTSVLDLAHAPFNGGTPLALIAGRDGKPYGEQLGDAAWRIEREISADNSQGTKAAREQLQSRGLTAASDVKGQFGWGLMDGSTTPTQVLNYLQQKGYSVEEAAYASKELNTELEGVTGMTANMVKANENNPGFQQEYLKLTERIATKGLQPTDADKLNQMVAMGELPRDQALKAVEMGQSRSNVLFSEGAATERSNREIAMQAQRDHRQEVNDAFTIGNRAREDNNADTQNLLISKGDTALSKTPQVVHQMEQVGNAAFRSYLAQHPAKDGVNDWQGASTAQRQALAGWASKRLSRLHPPTGQGNNGLQPAKE